MLTIKCSTKDQHYPCLLTGRLKEIICPEPLSGGKAYRGQGSSQCTPGLTPAHFISPRMKTALCKEQRNRERFFFSSLSPFDCHKITSSACQTPPGSWQGGGLGSLGWYSLVSAVSYSLSRSSSKMSTSTLALPARSGARLMRFLARVMESLSPLLHSMGSSRMAAAGERGVGTG